MGKNSMDMAYTRPEYIHGAPQPKISKFRVGDSTREYDCEVSLVASVDVEIKSEALEAARVTANRVMTRLLGEGSYLLKVVPYPHEVVREHKFMGFAGADRLSQGMSLSFGRPTGRAARVNANQEILTVYVDEEDVKAAKNAMKRASKKLPLKYNIDVQMASEK